MKSTTAVVVCVFFVVAGWVGSIVLNMNRPHIVQNVELTEILQVEVPQTSATTQSVQQAEMPQTSIAAQPVQYHACTSTGVVESATNEVDKRWGATISGVDYRSAILTPISDDNKMTRRIRVGQLVCIDDPEGDYRLRSREIRVLRQPEETG